MRNPKMKRFISLLLIFLIFASQLLSGTVIVDAVDTLDVKLATYYTNKANIYSGSDFDMSLTVENLSSSDITNVNIIIDGSSSFSLKNSGSIPAIGPITASQQSTTPFSTYTYNGGSNKLQVTIKYRKDSKDYQLEDSITISQAIPQDDTPSPPVDTTKYAPKIAISNNSAIPNGSVGSKISYTLPIKNTSLYAARNIIISPVFDDSSPFIVETMNVSQTVESLQPNEAKSVTFSFTISSDSQIKNYPIKFNIQYYNYSNDYFSSSETAYLNVSEGVKLPKLTLKSVSTNPSPVQAGENFKLNITLENEGTVFAKDISITLLGLKNDGASIIGNTNKKTIAKVYGGRTSILTFDLAASSKMEVGASSLKIKLDFKDSTGSTFSDEIEFFYNVQDSSNLSNIELKNIVAPSTSLKPGDNAIIGFDIVNIGTADAQNVKVSIATDKEIIPKSLNTIILPLLKKGESKSEQFHLFITDEIMTKNYPIAITVEYDAYVAGTKTKQTVMQYVGLYVENQTGKSVPKLIINKYSINPNNLYAGQQFTLDLSILNTSKSSTINNIKVSLSSDDGTFTTVDSNSFYVDSLSPKGIIEKKVVFSSKPDAPAKQYMISVNYEYEDEKGAQFTSKDSVGIPIQQTAKLVIGELNIPPEAYVGSAVPINLSFFNMGKSILYNLMVKLEGEFNVEGSSYFVGNFEPGKTDSFDGAVMPNAPGPITGSVLFSFEDADGKTQEIRKEIALNVMEMPIQPEFPGDGQTPPVEGGNKIPVWVFIVSGVVLLAIIATVIFVVRKKIKARKELMFDEEI